MTLRTLGIGLLLAALAMAMLGLPAGCAVAGSDIDKKPAVLGRAGAEYEQVQGELMSFVDTFISTIVQQWNQADASMAAGTDEPGTPGAAPAERAKRVSLEIKIANVSGALGIATGSNPIVGVADMITMITLQRMILEDPWAARLLGPEKAARLVATYREQEAKAWRMAEGAFTPEQRAGLRTVIDRWRAEHPDQRYTAGVRLEDFARDRGTTGAADAPSGPTSLFAIVGLDPLANLDPTVREVQRSRMLAERVFFYTQHAAPLVKWQTESLYSGFLQSQDVRQMMGSMVKVSQAAENVAAVADRVRQDLPKERHDALVDVFDLLKIERRDAMEQFFTGLAEERKQTLLGIESGQATLAGTLKQVKEAVAATEALSVSVRGTIQAADSLAARFTPPPGTETPIEPGPKPDPLLEYRQAAAQTAQTAEKLTQLAERVEKLLDSPQLDAKAGNLRTVVDSLQESVQQTVNRAFWWVTVLAVVTAFCLGAAIALGLSGHKAMERRSAAKRRSRRAGR
ncbi:MAG TPA: hypothetical protein PKE29_15855 [Phycisphaerales bacterium]|nr:hypothetical protein [Phycisphaerales bacterium]